MLIYQYDTFSYIRGCLVVRLGKNEVFLRNFYAPTEPEGHEEDT
jgi:hypothetical protein